MHSHETYMQRCLALATKGLGHVAPNPMVGCVIVYADKIIGEGYHQQYGQAHAEVNAIRSVADEQLLKQATLYVNLEPCSHFGKTPPCADLIIQKGIPRVVIGSNDPNPQVAGDGIKKLREAGVEVITGVLQKESDFLNRRFITFHTKHRPYIILKWAQSADGIMAPNGPEQLWLTNDLSKKRVHQWRSEETAILVGNNTLKIDDPQLNVRLVEGKDPLRIVIGQSIRPRRQQLFNGSAPVWVFNAELDRQEGNATFIKLDFDKPVLPQVMDYLFPNHIQSLIVEGGPATLQHFVEADLWDEARIFTTQHVLNEGKKAPVLKGEVIEEEVIETDKLQVLLNAR